MSEERKDLTAQHRQRLADLEAAEQGVPFPDPPVQEEEDPGDHDFQPEP